MTKCLIVDRVDDDDRRNMPYCGCLKIDSAALSFRFRDGTAISLSSEPIALCHFQLQ